MRTTIGNLVCAGLLLAASSPARALTIVRTNDASMSDPNIISPADAAAASAAFDYAAGQIMALYSDPVQINIILAATTNPAVLGQSNAPLVGTFTYDQIRTLLINDNNAHPSPDGTTSTAALPAVNPYACTTFLMARSLAKALGNIPSDATNDGTFTFGTTHAYTYDPANRAVPTRFDFIGVALHEITEIMGRVARLNQTGNCNRPYDVFRFLGAGTQSLIFTDSNVYFSVDGGTTNLKNFNANGNGGDLGDWASGSNDAFNAFSSSGVENDLTPVDARVMDVIGWDLVTGSPRAAVGDFNGDGHPDYVVQNASTHQTAVWYLSNNFLIGTAFAPALPGGWGLRAVADFNRDAHPDYGLFNPGSAQTAIWYLSGPTPIGSAYGPGLPGGWELVGTADFNGDNYPDYVLYNAGTHQTAIWYLINSLYISGAYGPTLPTGWSVAGVADFNRDGHPDYALFNSSTGQTAIWYLFGPTLIGGLFGPTVPGGWQLVAVADFNGDGYPDYVLYNALTLQTAIWYLSNNIPIGSAYGPTLPAGWSLVAP